MTMLGLSWVVFRLAFLRFDQTLRSQPDWVPQNHVSGSRSVWVDLKQPAALHDLARAWWKGRVHLGLLLEDLC